MNGVHPGKEQRVERLKKKYYTTKSVITSNSDQNHLA